jgi:uncharacterized protein
MKRILFAAAIILTMCEYAAAQQSPTDAPATKEDVEKFLQVMQSKDMIMKMMDAMSKPMHQMIREQYMKDKDKLPADFEARMTKLIDDQMKAFPWDEILQSMVPVYQKHLTKGDVAALVAFYSSPVGKKMLKEMPAMTAEAMQNMMPYLRKNMDSMNQRIQEEVAAMVRAAESKNGKTGTQINN